MAPPFPRTECACPADRDYCRRAPGFLIPEDVQKIGDYLVEQGTIDAPDRVLAYLRASKGAVVGDSRTGRVFRIGTITPRMEDGRCVFLDDAERCRIHPVAPFACSRFDAHMSPEEGQRRSAWGLRQIVNSPGYELVRSLLVLAGGEAEPLDAILATPKEEPT
jgi:Fe-S-cluster containining protein